MFDLSPKAKKQAKKVLRLLPFILLAAIFSWYMAIKPTLAYFEKKKFEAAYSELQKISANIQSKTGLADSVIDDNSCGRANIKNSQGPLSCNVGITLEYVNLNPDEASNTLETVSTLNNYPLRNGPLTSKTTFEESKRKSPQIIYQDIDEIKKMSCTISYEFRQNVEGPSNSILRIIPNCSESALIEHYKIR